MTSSRKVVHPTWRGASNIDRLKDEVAIAARLRHRNIVSVYFTREESGYLCVAMQLFPDGTLADQLARSGAFSGDQIRSVLAQVLEGLQHLHSQSDPIIHRDLKPQNILYDSLSHRYVITDFGLAKVLRADVTLSFTVAGTLPYMAPEQFRMELVCPETDVYAAGVVGLEVALGRYPFSSTDVPGLVAEKNAPPDADLRSKLQALASGLVDALLKAIQPVTTDRWRSADEMRAAVMRVR